MTASGPPPSSKLLPGATAESLALVRRNVPPELRTLHAWVVGDRSLKQTKNGEVKSSKAPINPLTGAPAKSNDPTTWGTFDEAIERAAQDDRAFGVGVNLLGSEFVGLDLDHVVDPSTGAVNPRARDLLEALPRTYVELSPSGTGLRAFFAGRKPRGFVGCSITDAFGDGTGIEVYDGDGGGRYLTTTGRVIASAPIAAATEENMAPLVHLVLQERERKGRKSSPSSNGKVPHRTGKATARNAAHDSDAEHDLARAPFALEVLDPNMPYTDWLRVGVALKALGNEGLSLWREWSKKSGKYQEGDCDSRWQGLEGSSIASLFGMADDANRAWRNRCASRATPAPVAAGDDDDDEPLTDVSNARLLVDRRGAWLRHCASLGWLEWNGSRWVRCVNDEQLQHAVAVIEAFYTEAVANLKKAVSAMKGAKKAGESDDTIRELEREMKTLVGIQAHAVASQRVSRLQAMLTIAASDPRITVHAAALDADPWLLNCPNGTVDLRTGELRPHREQDLLTHMAGAPYDPTADCPLWKQTLAEVFAGEDADEIINYVQRAAGYSASGITREEVFFLLHGDGRNGKGVVTETLQSSLGSYARNAPMSLFLEAHGDGAKRFAVAEFHGVRMTVASEVAEGRAFDLAVLKSWTGGDTRYAERKGRDPFEYKPTDKPWLLVNDKPKVKSWDVAFEERLHLVPFEHSFTGSSADKTRKSRLRDELTGILNWIVQGCLAWQKHGLMPPARCRAAAAEYRRESTRADEFIAERLIRVVGMTVAQSDVFAAYRDWSRHRDHPMVTERRFGTYLDAAGYERNKGRRGQIVANAALRPDDSPPPSRDDGDDGDALLTQPPISKNEFPLRSRVGTASPSSPSSPGAASSRPADDDPPRTSRPAEADAADPTAELTRLVGEMADDLDAALQAGTGPITGAALQTYYRDHAQQFGVEVALADARARHAAQVAGNVLPLPGTPGANCGSTGEQP